MQKLSYKAAKQPDGTLHVINRKIMIDDIARLPKGNYTLTIEKYRKSKSLPQLGYLFGCVYPLFLRAAVDAGYDELTTIDEVDAWCKSMFANREIVNKNTGEIIKVPGFKREMTTTEMMTYIDQVRDKCQEYFGVFIPDPESQTDLNFER